MNVAHTPPPDEHSKTQSLPPLIAPALVMEHAEKEVLAALMIAGLEDKHNALLKRLGGLEEQYFVGVKHRVIVRAMNRLAERSETISYNTVHSELRDMKNTEGKNQTALDYVTEAFLQQVVMNVSGGDQTAELDYQTVKRAWVRRDLSQTMKKGEALASNGDKPLQVVVQEAAELLEAAKQRYTILLTDRAQTMAEGMRAITVNMQSNAEGAIGLGWHTGIQGLTDASGGFERKKITLFGGRPGAGKSILLQTSAMSVFSQGVSPLLLSVEMKEITYWQRILSAESGVPLTRIKTGQMSLDEKKLIVEVLGRLEKHKMSDKFRIRYMNMPTLADMRARINQEYHDRGIDILFLDYAGYSKITPTNDRLTPRDQMTRIMAWLVNVANDFNIPVVAAVQMKRDFEQRGGEPRKSDIEESGAAEKDADVVALLGDEKKVPGTGEAVVDLHIVKSREGHETVVPLLSRKSIFTFSDLRD